MQEIVIHMTLNQEDNYKDDDGDGGQRKGRIVFYLVEVDGTMQ